MKSEEENNSKRENNYKYIRKSVSMLCMVIPLSHAPFMQGTRAATNQNIYINSEQKFIN